ncbi:MAG: glycosyltransferase [Patescibacteria group bacterium]|jgi:glycosyltransferase involved in cell wall biosynthesis
MFKQNKKPLVTIIIPVYNGEKYLREAIDSVIEQNYQNWELVIVNDASTDSSGKIAFEYVKKDKRIKLTTHKKNKYRASALNTGIKLAKGKYISFLDADDIYSKDKTDKQVEFLEKNLDIDLVYGNMEIFDDNGKKYIQKAIDFKKDPRDTLLEVSEKEITPSTSAFSILCYKNEPKGIPGCSVMIRKKVFENLSFDENLKTSQDYDFWFQLIGRGYKLAKMPILAYYYRHHSEQISRTKNQELKSKSYNYIIKKLKNWEYFKVPGKTKPKILLVPNIPNWAFDFEANDIIEKFSNSYDFTKLYHNDFLIGYENYSKYDKIFVFFWPGAKHILSKLSPEEAKKKLIVGIFSFNSWERKKRELQTLLKKCRGVVVNDKKIYQLFKSDKYETFYAKKWINLDNFKPKLNKTKDDKKLLVGWSGNPDHHGTTYKGYWNILVPVCKRNKDWITLKSALKSNPIPFNKISDFYNSIDVITCLSKGETGPNSLLEAGACAKPAISVRVGVAEELIKNNYNGLLIKRSKQALEKALKKLYDNKKQLNLMGQRMRQEVLKNWTRDKNINIYKKIFS